MGTAAKGAPIGALSIAPGQRLRTPKRTYPGPPFSPPPRGLGRSDEMDTANGMARIVTIALIAQAVCLAAAAGRCRAGEEARAYRHWPPYRKVKDVTPQPWRTRDDVIDGWDWSLPPGIRPSPHGLVRYGKDPNVKYPGRRVRDIRWTWNRLEPVEGKFDFEPLRAEILKAAAAGWDVQLYLLASVWTRQMYPDASKTPEWMKRSWSAPRWLARYDIPRITEKRPRGSRRPFRIVNLDVLHPEYHKRYVRMLKALGESGIPKIKALRVVYVTFMSASNGEEGEGPRERGVRSERYRQRLKAWADAFEGNARKLCSVASGGFGNKLHQEHLKYAYSLGLGQRSGFVEMYLFHVANPALGQSIDTGGYLVVDESCPPIRDNRVFGDENEEYHEGWTGRFGPLESFTYRYHHSMLRALQMRRNYLMLSDFTPDPHLLAFVAMQLGRTVADTPDAWCRLRQSTARRGGTVKNFERWLHQRDATGARTTPCMKVPAPMQRGHDPKRLYDYNARRTDIAAGNRRISFAVDDRFGAAGPHKVAVKVTYLDTGAAEWALAYTTPAGQARRTIRCGNTNTLKTATFFLDDACFAARKMAFDFSIEAVKGDVTLCMVRVIRLPRRGIKRAVPPAPGGAEGT